MQRWNSSNWAIVALLTIAFIWGYNWVQMKIAVQYASPFAFAALRNALGSANLLLAMIWLRKPLLPKAVLGTVLLGVLQNGGVYGFSTWALVSGGAGKTAVLVYTMPFWVILFAWLTLGERLHKLQWIALGFGFVGFLFILELQRPSGNLFSKGLAVMAGISWAAGSIVAKKLQKTANLDLLSLTTWQTFFGTIPLTFIALLVPSQPIVWSAPFIGALLYSVIPGTAIALLLWLYALSRLPAGIAGLGTLLNPVLGVLFAWLQLGEHPSTLELVGMALIGCALILNTIQSFSSGVTKVEPQVALKR